VNGADIALAGRTRDRVSAHAPAIAPELLFQRGREHATAGHWQEAAIAFAAVAAARPADPVPWLNLSHARLQLGEFDSGAEAACRALALEPGSELGLNLAAQCLEHTGRLRELAELFATVDMDAISDSDLHLRLGIALTRLGRFEGAVKALLDALRRNIRSTAAYAQLGNVFQLLKMPEEARESFRNALALGRSPVEMATAIVFTSLEACSWADIPADMAALDGRIARGEGQPNPFYCLNFSWSDRKSVV
jgi:tetratricopeptide (TPR) repeat protein